MGGEGRREGGGKAVGYLNVCVSWEEGLKNPRLILLLFLCCSVENRREGGQRRIKRVLFSHAKPPPKCFSLVGVLKQTGSLPPSTTKKGTERRATYGGQRRDIVPLSLSFNRPLHFQSILLNASLIAFQ